ncbi:RNA polymerase sigma-70 factor [Parabacteroides sp.]
MEQWLLGSGQDDYSKAYTIYFPKLVRFSETYLLSEEDAENLVQDIFLYLWEHKEQIPLLGNLNAYLFTMVKNRCIDFLRKQTRAGNTKLPLSELEEKELQFKLYSLQKFDENHFSVADIDTLITQAIDSLPERCREIFILSRMEGLRHKEIAERLNISINTIESQIAIALKKLKVALKDYAPLFVFII